MSALLVPDSYDYRTVNHRLIYEEQSVNNEQRGAVLRVRSQPNNSIKCIKTQTNTNKLTKTGPSYVMLGLIVMSNNHYAVMSHYSR